MEPSPEHAARVTVAKKTGVVLSLGIVLLVISAVTGASWKHDAVSITADEGGRTVHVGFVGDLGPFKLSTKESQDGQTQSFDATIDLFSCKAHVSGAGGGSGGESMPRGDCNRLRFLHTSLVFGPVLLALGLALAVAPAVPAAFEHAKAAAGENAVLACYGASAAVLALSWVIQTGGWASFVDEFHTDFGAQCPAGQPGVSCDETVYWSYGFYAALLSSLLALVAIAVLGKEVHRLRQSEGAAAAPENLGYAAM